MDTLSTWFGRLTHSITNTSGSCNASRNSAALCTLLHLCVAEFPAKASAIDAIFKLCGVSKKGEKKSSRYFAEGRKEKIPPPLLFTQTIFPTRPPPRTLINPQLPGATPAAIAIPDISCIVATSPMRRVRGVLLEEQL